MTPAAARSFTAWLMKDQPELFIALAQSAGVPVIKNLAGFSDILGAIGSGISNAASAVGTFLTSSQGLTTLATLATTYVSSQAQKSALNLQLAQAQANKPAAPIETQYNPTTAQYEVLYTQQNGQKVPLTAQDMASFNSIVSKPWFPFVLAGGVAFILFFLFRRR